MVGGLGIPELIVLFFLLLPGIIGGIIARRKGRSDTVWFFLCFFLPLLILVILFLKPAGEVKGKIRQCPYCKEYIKWHAVVCKHCSSNLEAITA